MHIFMIIVFNCIDAICMHRIIDYMLALLMVTFKSWINTRDTNLKKKKKRFTNYWYDKWLLINKKSDVNGKFK